MMTFDNILPVLTNIFLAFKDDIATMRPVLVNRDLNGRIRLIIDEKWEDSELQQATLTLITRQIFEKLGAYAYPPEHSLLFEPDIQGFLDRESSFPLVRNK